MAFGNLFVYLHIVIVIIITIIIVVFIAITLLAAVIIIIIIEIAGKFDAIHHFCYRSQLPYNMMDELIDWQTDK